MLGLASNTIVAYGRGIEGFLAFCQTRSVDVRRASREVIAQYVHHLLTQPRNGRANVFYIDSGALLSNATLQQRLTAVRLFFEFLVEDELIKVNPVGRGRYTLSKRFGVHTERALVQRFHKLPWIPSEEPTVTYQYRFAGQTYEGRRITAMDAAEMEQSVRLIVASLPPGRIVTAYVDPTEPSYALLRPGFFWYLPVWAVLALLGSTLGIFGMIWAVASSSELCLDRQP
jgi:hypothetical protein